GDDPKKKGGASGSNTELTLFFQANDTNGTLLIIFKLTGNDNYKIRTAAVHLALHAKNKSYNSLWRQFDSLVDLPSCTCDGATKSKEHKDLMRLMQFLMGLDDTYNVVRSQILTTGPDLTSAFATLSRVESHKNILVHTSSTSPSSSAFVFELNEYPPGFQKGNSGGTSVSNNASSSVVKSDQSAGPPSPFTTDQINRIMAFISLNSDSGFSSKVPNGDWIPSAVLSGKSPYEMIYKNEPSLSHVKSFGCLCFATILNNKNKFAARSDKYYSNEPYDDKRDNENGDSDGILKSHDYAEVSTDTSSTATSHSEKVVNRSPKRTDNSSSDGLGSTGASPKGSDATLFDEEYEFEGEDFIESNQLFDSELTNVKYDINFVISYANMSIENFVFSTNLNKIHEPKSFAEAANDPRWIEAMNQDMEALNSNKTWEITEFSRGKAIGSKWIFKVKYKSSRDVERFKAILVAQGFRKKEDIDYEETFSLVVKICV
ncbi:putative RNA-directed DNA polymerase, partial [Tanacetum coccineum]